MSSFSLRFYHIVSVQNVVGKAPCADFIALCGDTGINGLHTFLKYMELKFVIPNMEKTFGNLEFAGEDKTEQRRINGRMACVKL